MTNLKKQTFILSLLPLVALSLLTAESARADSVTVALELGPEYVLNEEPTTDDFSHSGFGAALRGGYTFDTPLVDLTPELKVGFQAPGAPKAFSAAGGLRLNFLEGISPAVFAHAGGLIGDVEGLVIDAGAGLDFTVIPLFDLGVFASYNVVGNASFDADRFSYESTNWQWLHFGGQVAFHF